MEAKNSPKKPTEATGGGDQHCYARTAFTG